MWGRRLGSTCHYAMASQVFQNPSIEECSLNQTGIPTVIWGTFLNDGVLEDLASFFSNLQHIRGPVFHKWQAMIKPNTSLRKGCFKKGGVHFLGVPTISAPLFWIKIGAPYLGSAG